MTSGFDRKGGFLRELADVDWASVDNDMNDVGGGGLVAVVGSAEGIGNLLVVLVAITIDSVFLVGPWVMTSATDTSFINARSKGFEVRRIIEIERKKRPEALKI